MYRVLLRFGNIEIQSYGLMMTLAFVAWIFFSMSRAKKRGIAPDHVVHLSLIVFFVSAIGARLLYVAMYPDRFKGHPGDILPSFHSSGVQGLSLFGGLMLALAAIAIYCYLRKIPVLRLFDAMAPAFGVGLFIFRIGCFLNGCCYGKPSDLPWAVKFPLPSPAGFNFPDIKIHPTQLYSALFGLGITLFLLKLDRKKRFDGYLFSVLGIAYCAFRFLIDFLRYSSPSEYGLLFNLPITTNQFISFCLFCCATGLYFVLRKRSGVPFQARDNQLESR